MCQTQTPIVMWPGLGDNCDFPFSMGYVKTMIEKNIPGAYVHCLMIGDGLIGSEIEDYLGNTNSHVEQAYAQIQATPELRGRAINAIGFSQGGQFLRGLQQRHGVLKNLVSVGGQHQGVFGLPKCPGVNETVCEWIREMIDIGVYEAYIQEAIVPAQYWHDPLDEALYAKSSIFIGDINNQGLAKNATYAENLKKLENFVMVKFLEDSIVQPRISEHFGFYAPGQDVEVVPLQNTTLYQEDWLGLKEMDAAGKLHFLDSPGDHLQFTPEFFVDKLIPFLKK